MLRAVSIICLENRAFERISVARRDFLTGYRRGLHSATPLTAQTVVSSESAPPASPGPPAPPPRPPPQDSSTERRSWSAAAIAAALTFSIGGVYFFMKKNEDVPTMPPGAELAHKQAVEEEQEGPRVPASGAEFPPHVQYLLVGAGTAAFAAMRAIRSAVPDSRVLLVGEERVLPYMRPPLSKELWREPALAAAAAAPDNLTFRQWNGKRRPLVYEPQAFYTPVQELSSREYGGAAVARGWRVTKIDVAAHTAELRPAGVAVDAEPVVVRYDKCLVATGARPRRHPALRSAAAAGKSLALRHLRDAVRLAAALDDPKLETVAIVGGGFLATELSSALASRLRDTGKKVVQVIAEPAPLAGVLPHYLAQDAATRLTEAGVTLLTQEDVQDARMEGDNVVLQLSGGSSLTAGLVVECVGAEVEPGLALASDLETHPDLGGLLVNAELQARADVWAAGDNACFYDVSLGRRRVEHHDHAVISGRLAGNNMAAAAAGTQPKHYTHQSMFWSDLGPQLGYEAIGIIDSRLRTVGVFSADAVTPVSLARQVTAVDSAESAGETAAAGQTAAVTEATVATTEDEPSTKRYERGVVFYLRGTRVVGVLLWNLFNRMHVARQVVAQGEFEDLFEVGKLFAPHEEE